MTSHQSSPADGSESSNREETSSSVPDLDTYPEQARNEGYYVMRKSLCDKILDEFYEYLISADCHNKDPRASHAWMRWKLLRLKK